MGKNFSVEDLSEIIEQSLAEYKNDVDEKVKQEIEETAKEILQNLKSDPVIPQRTGEYKKGFRLKRVADGEGFRRIAVYNKKHQLTHLLEKGHKTKNGKTTRAFPHWKQAQETADKLPERIKERLAEK